MQEGDRMKDHRVVVIQASATSTRGKGIYLAFGAAQGHSAGD
jgi:hypothetical protein